MYMNINGIWKSVADVFSTEIAKRCENMSHSVSVEDLVIYYNQSINFFYSCMYTVYPIYTATGAGAIRLSVHARTDTMQRQYALTYNTSSSSTPLITQTELIQTEYRKLYQSVTL